MIKSFKHKGLEKFFLTGSKAGIQAAHANKLRLILGRLNASTSPRDMNLPGLYLHELNWRQTGYMVCQSKWQLADYIPF
ncbi:MAG: type II toxin-antitoxin system RelE/ParE family toxin [Candidatus Promineifilaceae bacterium]